MCLADLKCYCDRNNIRDVLGTCTFSHCAALSRDGKSYDFDNIRAHWRDKGKQAGLDPKCGVELEDGRITLKTADEEACFLPEGVALLKKFANGNDRPNYQIQNAKYKGTSIAAIASSKPLSEWYTLHTRTCNTGGGHRRAHPHVHTH